MGGLDFLLDPKKTYFDLINVKTKTAVILRFFVTKIYIGNKKFRQVLSEFFYILIFQPCKPAA